MAAAASPMKTPIILTKSAADRVRKTSLLVTELYVMTVHPRCVRGIYIVSDA